MERYEGLFDAASVQASTQTEEALRLRSASSDASTSTQPIECCSVAVETGTQDDQEDRAASEPPEQHQEALDALDRSWREKYELRAEEGRRALEEARAATREEQLSREEAQDALKEARAALAALQRRGDVAHLEGSLGQTEALRAQNIELVQEHDRLERSASADAARLADAENSRDQLVRAVAEARQQAAEVQDERDSLRVERNTTVQSLEVAVSRVQLLESEVSRVQALESEVAQLTAAVHVEAEARAQQQRLEHVLQARVDSLEAKLRHVGEQLQGFTEAMGIVEPWAASSFGAAGESEGATTTACQPRLALL